MRTHNHYDIVGVTVFVQYEDETKRITLHEQPRTLDHIREVFLRAFPQVSVHVYTCVHTLSALLES